MANQLKMAKIHSILTLHQNGWSNRRIAKELCIHRDAVRRHIRLTREQDSKPAKAPPGSGDSEAAKPAKAPMRRYETRSTIMTSNRPPSPRAYRAQKSARNMPWRRRPRLPQSWL